MVEVGKGVDHRHRGVAGQLVDDLLAVGADHQAVHVAGHDPRHVFQRFVAGELGVAAGEVDHLAAQPVHGRFEGNPGAGGRFFKNQGDGLAGQLLVADVVLALFLQRGGQIQVAGQFFPGEVPEG